MLDVPDKRIEAIHGVIFGMNAIVSFQKNYIKFSTMYFHAGLLFA